MNPLLDDACRRATAYLDGLGQRGVAPLKSDVDRLAGLRVPLQDEPRNAHDVLAQLDAMGSPTTAAMAGARFFGFVIGGTQPAGDGGGSKICLGSGLAFCYSKRSRQPTVVCRWPNR